MSEERQLVWPADSCMGLPTWEELRSAVHYGISKSLVLHKLLDLSTMAVGLGFVWFWRKRSGGQAVYSQACYVLEASLEL